MVLDASRRGLAVFNELSESDAKAAVASCCPWPEWGESVVALRPYGDASELELAAADAIAAISDGDLPLVLNQFPPIAVDGGARTRAAQWSREEESGVHGSEASLKESLIRTGAEYRERFGYTFVVAATGLEGTDVLSVMRERLTSDPKDELAESRRQLDRICRMRVAKLLPQLDPRANAAH
ncbi:2-oxo-4-hydroxy-4-carboxy-5-ureidoimidazoline decarboxylase [Sinomonas sp. JGH33]|uniref:2-oxo-4-hydroxy-4-carboxy-5-ureidoimidazoline decarboxylase n=1 Tax=Sinomonas terricola TaxID=3110330 RepID=A0ABU5T7T4_9MICC|nr:2-oxo-4-hydroxy-4-carboxy-5-ureidoimidazoline decarboxylase [Sinomonas sp. JGH33]MEA5455722.1 2-oxo-4-hydroxy-4-carboxy-5-ureidoimidazoline decarboxylase [Sinomonas sp. JGH33]